MNAEYQKLRDEFLAARLVNLPLESPDCGRMTDQLRQFCASGGHDLQELDQFLQSVEQQVDLARQWANATVYYGT